jgi:hypothetical protein
VSEITYDANIKEICTTLNTNMDSIHEEVQWGCEQLRNEVLEWIELNFTEDDQISLIWNGEKESNAELLKDEVEELFPVVMKSLQGDDWLIKQEQLRQWKANGDSWINYNKVMNNQNIIVNKEYKEVSWIINDLNIDDIDSFDWLLNKIIPANYNLIVKNKIIELGWTAS